mgnify:CR=1 FL=1
MNGIQKPLELELCTVNEVWFTSKPEVLRGLAWAGNDCCDLRGLGFTSSAGTLTGLVGAILESDLVMKTGRDSD